jgi:crotonobetainyl-CoA:carnitine CoA-transferase CaiB-like acyl-CoA transferase
MLMTYFISGTVPARRGNEGVGGIPSDMWRCADGFVLGVAGNDSQYKRLCSAMRRSDLAEDPRFVTNSERQKHKRELYAVWRQEFAKWSTKDAETVMLAAGLPTAPVNDMANVCADPQVMHREMVRAVSHPTAGTVKLLSYPVRFSDTPVTDYLAPPALGANTTEILTDLLGMDLDSIQVLKSKGVI